MNIGELLDAPMVAEERVRWMQSKLHRWSGKDTTRCFDDMFNLVADPAFLVVAWRRVRGNQGSRTAGIDGHTARTIEAGRGMEAFLNEIRTQVKTRAFEPSPVRERLIPKPGTSRRRRLGIPSVADRVVQATLKLILEPIFERDFHSCSYGFRPNRRPHDAIAKIHHYTKHGYRWVVEGDIEACFESISHSALLERMRRRVADKHVLALVKAFLKSGILTEFGQMKKSLSGAPQGEVLSPLLANIALSVLDDYFAEHWQNTMQTRSMRRWRRRRGLPNWRLIRFADDWVALVDGTRADAETLRDEITKVLAPMGLTLSAEKTTVVHLDQGFDFLSHHIQRRHKKGTSKRYVYTYPSKNAVQAAKRKVKTLTRRNRHRTLENLVREINTVLPGWCYYHRHGVAQRTFDYLGHYTWWRVARWIVKRHKEVPWKRLRREVFTNRWRIVVNGIELFNLATVTITRYRYRGHAIPTPWEPACPS